MGITRYLPEGQDRPKSYAQLSSCLCSLLARHLEKGTDNAINLLAHMRYLADRSAEQIYDLSKILSYDMEVRKLAESKGMVVLTYGIQTIINNHLGTGGLKSAIHAASASTSTKSGKSKWSKKKGGQAGSADPKFSMLDAQLQILY